MRPIGPVLAATLLVFTAAVVTTATRGAQSPEVAKDSSFRDLARQQSPVVVSIEVRARDATWDDAGEEPRGQFGLDVGAAGPRFVRTAASGIVLNNRGEILTNHHVVAGVDRIDVTLFGADRRRYRARLVATDPLSDTALIRLDHPPADLHAATLGDSNQLEPGDWVIAIGNPFQFGHTVTAGVVSFRARPFQVGDGHWQDLIQTDAAISRGSSGGPLFNLRGEVVGMNVAMVDIGNGVNPGIGFAVPINTIRELLPQLRTGQVVRGQLGIGLHGGPILSDEAAALRLSAAMGAVVRSVDAGSAAERAGLRAGDVIVAIDGEAIVDTRALLARTSSTRPGTRVTVTVFREGRQQTLTAVVERQPSLDVAPSRFAATGHDDGMLLRDGTGAAIVEAIAPDSPADDAELEAGDLIKAINGRQVVTAADAQRMLRQIPDDQPAFLLVLRHGSELFLELRRD